jgi:hypothetical protein
LLCFWKFRTNFLYQKIKEKETLNFEQNLEESCDIKFEFCDIEILAKLSQNSANVVKFYTRKKKLFPNSFVPPKKKKKKKKRKRKKRKAKEKFAPQINKFITLCVFTTNKRAIWTS